MSGRVGSTASMGSDGVMGMVLYGVDLCRRIRLRITPLAFDDRTSLPVVPWLKACPRRWRGRSGGSWARLRQSERETDTGS